MTAFNVTPVEKAQSLDDWRKGFEWQNGPAGWGWWCRGCGLSHRGCRCKDIKIEATGNVVGHRKNGIWEGNGHSDGVTNAGSQLNILNGVIDAMRKVSIDERWGSVRRRFDGEDAV